MKLTIKIRAKHGKLQELYQTLQAIIPTIRKEKGCRECRIYQDVEDGEIFFLDVQWDAQENLEHYMRSRSGSALLGAIELLSEKEGVRIGDDTPWEAIDSLKKMRKKPNVENHE